MADRRITILIVDTHQLFRECLTLALADDELIVLEPADSRLDAVNKIRRNSPEVVLVNSLLRDDSALELAKELGRSFPLLKIVMYGLLEPDDGYVEHIKAGLRGYVFEKQSSLAELKQTVRQVVVGEIACPPEVTFAMFARLNRLASENWWINRATTMKLTPREVQILELIAEGWNNREIGERLFLSLHTIKNHVHKILQKLQVSRRTDAVKYAHEKQWLKTWR